MAKKKSRQIRRPAPQTVAPVVEDVRPSGSKGDLSAEYHYVIRDLRQIALIAVGLIATLVILSFVI